MIDIGAQNTSVVPVHDGYVLKKAVQHQAVGGDFLSKQIVTTFQQQNLPIVPQYLVSSKMAVDSAKPPVYTEYPGRRDNTTESFHKFGLKRVADDFKETVCQVAESAYNPKYVDNRFS